MTEYDAARDKVMKYVSEVPLEVQRLDRAAVEERSITARKYHSVEQRCVNYLRHSASAYDSIIRALNGLGDQFSTKMERHVLHVERRGCVAQIKRRILDEIAATYPWLQAECERQKQRDGLEEDPGDFVLPFGPFKGSRLREVNTDYLLRLLGQSFVRKSFRTRIEHHLAQRAVACLPCPQ